MPIECLPCSIPSYGPSSAAHSPASARQPSTTYATHLTLGSAHAKTILSQVLLVPTTETLLNSRDKESNTSYVDLSGSEDFLASHVLRVPGGVGPNNHVKDAGSFRETRGKAKQFTTANGRTVIVKDAFVYSNKGAKGRCLYATYSRADRMQDSRR